MEYQNENFSGVLDFRCRWHDGFLVPLHLHEYSELLYVRSGTATVLIDRQTYHLSDRQFIFVPPNALHEYRCEQAEVICAVFSSDFIPLFFKKLNGMRLMPQAIDAGPLHASLENLYRLDPQNSLCISGHLNLICDLVLQTSSFRTDAFADSTLYQKVISHLSAHYTEDISLKGIAKTFGYNEKYLSWALHKLTGMHFRQLLAMYRVEHAKKLLDQPSHDCTIAQIAMQSGFSTINSFNRIFKDFTGVTPSQYRGKGLSQYNSVGSPLPR